MSPMFHAEMMSLHARERNMDAARTARSQHVLGRKGVRISNTLVVVIIALLAVTTGNTLLNPDPAIAESIR